MPEFSFKKIISIVLGAFLTFFILFNLGSIGEEVDNKEIVVIQHAFTGVMDVYTTPGWVPQYFGTATHYKKSFQYWFSKRSDEGDTVDQSIKVRFNDGGHGSLSGSVRVDLPTDKESILALHTKYGSQDAIENALIGTVINKAVYMTGPMMSSKESYAERRNDLISLVEDQAVNGVYKTVSVNTRVKDPMDTTQTKVVNVVQIVKDANGLPSRQEKSPISAFGVKMYNLSINSIDYDNIVEQQIRSQQQATAAVQTAIANAKKAEQDAYTTEMQGKANAAKAKWEQETIKAAAVTEAEKARDVAKLNADAEEQNKRALILKGEGEAAYKRAVTQANNNLEAKLDAWVKVNQAYASAMSQSNWVPTYVAGGSGNYSGGAMDLIHMMTAKTAKEWGLQVAPGEAAPNVKNTK